MAVAFIDAGQTDYASDVTAFSFNTPVGTAVGDVFVFSITTTSSTVLSPAPAPDVSPVTVIQAVTTHTGEAAQVAAWLYVVPASIPSTISVPLSAARQGTIAWMRFSGVDTADPLGSNVAITAFSGTSSGSRTLSAATVDTANSYVIGAVNMGSGSTTVTVPAAWTIRADGTRRNGVLMTKGIQAATGSSGTVVATLSVSQRAGGWITALKPASGPINPSFVHAITGFSTDGSIRAKVKVADATSVRLKVATNTGLTTGVVFGSASTPDAQGYCEVVCTGLSPWVQYYYGIEMTGATVVTTAQVGKAKTLPTAGTPTSFTIAFGSCNDYIAPPATSLTAFTNIAARNPDVFAHLGDFTYSDNSSTSQASHRGDLETTINYNASMRTVMASAMGIYMKSDHDAGPNNSFPGAQTPANRAAMLQVIPDLDCPDPDGLYGSRTIGRVKLIALDTRYFSVMGGTTRLGATQKAWFFNELLTSEPLKIVFMDSTWISNELPETDGDKWENFEAERTEIGDYIVNDAVGKVVIAHGDSHALAADDGTNNDWGGFETFCAAPFFNTSSIKTLNGAADWSQGGYPSVEGTPASQYGWFAITDAGDDITLAFTGYDSTNTSRVTQTVVVEPPEDHSGSVTLSGSGTLARTAAGVTASGSLSLSGSGTLTRAGTPATSSTLGRSGSGTLVHTAVPGISTNLALSGSGTQTLTPVSVTASGTLGLSGSGTLSRSAAGVTSSGTLGLSGSGTLSQNGSSSTSGSIALSGSGTQSRSVSSVTASGSHTLSGSGSLELAGTATEHASGSLSLSGSGTLARTGVPGTTSPLALSGSGELDRDVVAVSSGGTLTRTGAGTLLAAGEGDEVGAGTLERSGSGTLSATGTAMAASGFVSLSGSGSLGLSGAGAEDGEGSVGLSGTGTLTLSGHVGTSGSVSTNGSGLLGLEGKISVQSGLSRTGSGTLTLVGEGTVGGDGAVSFSGSGTLSLVGASTASGQLVLSGAGALARQIVQLVLSGALSLDGEGTLALTHRGAVQVPSAVSLEALPYTIELVAQESGDHDVVEIEEGGRVMLIVKHGDTHEVSWKTNLDLTGATVRMFFRRKTSRTGEPEHAATEVDSYIINAVDGVVGHTLTGDLVVADYDVEVQATIDGQVISAPNNDYELMRVEKDLM